MAKIDHICSPNPTSWEEWADPPEGYVNGTCSQTLPSADWAESSHLVEHVSEPTKRRLAYFHVSADLRLADRLGSIFKPQEALTL